MKILEKDDRTRRTIKILIRKKESQEQVLQFTIQFKLKKQLFGHEDAQ